MRNHAVQMVCEKCGEKFYTRSNFTKWCDKCCTYSCEWCGKEFISRRRREVRFCSLDCANKWQRTPLAKERARKKTISVNGSGKIVRCKTCGENMYSPGWRVKRGNHKYCSHGCRNYKEDMKGINRVLRFPANNGLNGLEKAGKAILDRIGGVEYKEQQVIGGKFVVDVLIPDRSIIIQWDGDFWHGNPNIYPSPTHEIQHVNIRRDRQCDAYLSKCGYTVLRFWETDVHSNPSFVSSEIALALANSDKTYATSS